MTRIAFVLFSFLVGTGCSNHKAEPTVEAKPAASTVVFDQLVGTWKNVNEASFEKWIRLNDSLYFSKVYTINNGDTNWLEQARVYKNDGNWIFANVVKDQNNAAEVPFTSRTVNDLQVNFYNPSHDFPTEIQYHLVTQDSLAAFIAGPNKDGGTDTMRFNYTRLK